jgi:DNA (cytosine-5)-methyltransferase 1
LALFAGAGGGILGGKLLGWRTVCAVKWESYPASVLCARQNDGLLPPFPIWDDVQTFDGKPWRGIVDVVSGGFPCQDISAAGKGAGIDGERSGMWSHMARVVSEVRPRYVFVENSPMLVTRGLERVLGDLTSLGYDTKWTVMGAADVGANHQRDRIWIVAKWREQLPHAQHDRIRRWEQQQESIEKEARNVAYTSSKRWETNQHIGNIDGWSVCGSACEQGKDGGKQSLDNTNFTGLERCDHKQESPTRIQQKFSQRCFENAGEMAYAPGVYAQGQHSRSWEVQFGRKSWWEAEPNVGRVADGVAARVDRLKAIGNGQVPLCAATAWKVLTA